VTATIDLDRAATARARFVRPRWVRAYGYFAYQYKRIWRGSLTVSFLYPILYLTAMGIGVGTLVDHHTHGVGGATSYLDFVAPGLLAATAMQIGGNEATYPVLAGIKWWRTYHAMLATPLRVVDVLRGHLAWIGTRVALVSSIYLLVVTLFGVTTSALGILAIPAGIATGMAFAAPIAAFAATQDRDVGFTTIYRLGMIPLFLFSGTFFPVSQLPGWLQPVAYAFPLYHGVALCRGLILGTATLWPSVAHALYLVAVATIGYLVAERTFTKRLVV
jgi:lipooligosaccharide transport system permease protein